jgi:uncharacterized protein YodC (DUF2158 family)
MDELINQIKSFDNHDDLRTIQSALKSQWELIERNIKNEFKVSDIVQLKRSGRRGTITKINPKTIDVLTDNGFSHSMVRCSPSLVEKVDD